MPAGCNRKGNEVLWVKTCSGNSVCGTYSCTNCEVLACSLNSYDSLQAAGEWLDLSSKSVSQSSTGSGGPASKAVDGDATPQFGGKSCTHTHKDHRSWWEVDLGSQHKITEVKVTNRAEAGSRLNGFSVLVDDRVCASNVGINQGETKEVPCSDTGRRIKLRLNKREHLTICEFAVFATSAIIIKAKTPPMKALVAGSCDCSQHLKGWEKTRCKDVGNGYSRLRTDCTLNSDEVQCGTAGDRPWITAGTCKWHQGPLRDNWGMNLRGKKTSQSSVAQQANTDAPVYLGGNIYFYSHPSHHPSQHPGLILVFCA